MPLLLTLLLFIGCFKSVAQNSHADKTDRSDKTALKPYPYELDKEWSEDLYIRGFSPDGNWVAFIEAFPIQKNVLHLKHTENKTNFSLPDGWKNTFSKDNKWFGSLAENKNFVLINLESKQRENMEAVQEFDFSHSGKYLSILEQDALGNSSLKIRDLEAKTSSTLEGVINFVWNPVMDKLLVVKKGKSNTIHLYEAGKETFTPVKDNFEGEIEHLKWNTTGSAAIIIEDGADRQRLGVYYLKEGFRPLEDTVLEQQLPEYKVGDREAFLSEDGETVLFFRRHKSKKMPQPDKIEVWKTTDPILYPKRKMKEDYITAYLLTAWFPKKGVVQEIATLDYPTASMDIEHNFAVVYNELQYEPQYRQYPIADIYIKEIQSGERHLVVEGLDLNQILSISPSGKYIAYFKTGDWWVYHVAENKTVNITNGTAASFQNKDDEWPSSRIEVYDTPAWSENDSKIILTDKYDLWVGQPDGKEIKRISRGREKNSHYKFRRTNDIEKSYQLTVGRLGGRKIDLDEKPLLQEVNYDTHSTGISVLNKDLSIEHLLYDDKKIYEVYKAPEGNWIIYKKESTTLPLSLNYYNIQSKKNKLIYQINEELLVYDLGQKSFINYTRDGKELMGTLMYPANYEPTKEYPLIVYIYEKASRNAIGFSSPNGYNPQGFSILSYTTAGYFVLLPDITYELGKPGISALECVNAAVDKVLGNKSIDKSRIGLIGHSFGGYETAFIATQSDRFATFVAGAAVTNFTSHYHGVNWNGRNTDLWRYEDQQWRMGVSYYENKAGYLANSPLEFVKHLKRPILLWTGDKDYIITWTQSIEMFIALRRLEKEASLILIKDEGHALGNKEKQLLLATEIKKWFDKYLKKGNGAS